MLFKKIKHIDHNIFIFETLRRKIHNSSPVKLFGYHYLLKYLI
jgi:hypothetical protein